MEDSLGVYDLPDDPPNPDNVSSVTGIPKGKKPKLVLLFCNNRIAEMDGDITEALVFNYRNLVVAGSVIDDLIPARDARYGASVDNGAFEKMQPW